MPNIFFFYVKYILSHVLMIFSHALQKYTYFDVLNNTLKHMQSTWL